MLEAEGVVFGQNGRASRDSLFIFPNEKSSSTLVDEFLGGIRRRKRSQSAGKASSGSDGSRGNDAATEGCDSSIAREIRDCILQTLRKRGTGKTC